MSKTVKFFEKNYEPILDSSLKFWLIRDIKIFDEEFEIEFPNENNEFPSNLIDFLNEIEQNWDLIISQSKDAIYSLSKDWYSKNIKPNFILLSIVLENIDKIFTYSLFFYDYKTDQYGQWKVKFYFRSLIGVEREWI